MMGCPWAGPGWLEPYWELEAEEEAVEARAPGDGEFLGVFDEGGPVVRYLVFPPPLYKGGWLYEGRKVPGCSISLVRRLGDFLLMVWFSPP